MSLEHLDLDGAGFWYLASPYTRQRDGIERAAEAAARMAGWLASLGIDAYCPIAESHYIARHSGLDPLDTELWMARNQPFIRAAHGLLVIIVRASIDAAGLSCARGYNLYLITIINNSIHQ